MYTHYSTPDSRMEALTELFGEETIDDDIYSKYLQEIANNPHNPWIETFSVLRTILGNERFKYYLESIFGFVFEGSRLCVGEILKHLSGPNTEEACRLDLAQLDLSQLAGFQPTPGGGMHCEVRDAII